MEMDRSCGYCPCCFTQKTWILVKRYKVVKAVSSITHGHIRSVIACFYYLEFALHLMNGKDKLSAYIRQDRM